MFFQKPGERGLIQSTGETTLKRDWLTAAFAGPHIDFLKLDKEGREIEEPRVNQRGVEISGLWENYRRATNLKEKSGWIVVSTVSAFLFFAALFEILGRPAFPHRGELVRQVYCFYLIPLNFAVLWISVFWACYEARACERLFRRINEKPTLNKWRCLPPNSREASFNASPSALSNYLSFRLIVRSATRIQSLIYLPFLSIVLIIIARSDVFDAMDLPVPIVILIGLSLLYAVHSQIILQKAAIATKDKALRDLTIQLFEKERFKVSSTWEEQGSNTKLAGNSGKVGFSEEATTLSAEQIRILMTRIRETRQGPFAPLSQQPFVQAVLLPFGGYGGVQLIEYLMAATLPV